MKRKSKDCINFAEYRLEVLELKQSDLAHHCKCKQAWISKLENGHMPEPWNLEKIVNGIKKLGHSITKDELKRLIIGNTIKEKQPVINEVLSVGKVNYSYSTNQGSVIVYAS